MELRATSTLNGQAVQEDDPQSPHLADARQRLSWAEDDCEAFHAASLWFASSEAYAVRTRSRGERWESRFHRWITPEFEADRLLELARVLGSFLHHVRAGLDYVTYELAQLAVSEGCALPELAPESVEYPIFQTPEEFRVGNRIMGLPGEWREFLETHQPYPGRDGALWTLQELSRQHRHRIVDLRPIVLAAGAGEALVDGDPLPLSDAELVTHGRLEHEDVVLRFALPGTGPEADVDPGLATTVGIEHPLCDGIAGGNVVRGILHAAAAAALDIEERFFLD